MDHNRHYGHAKLRDDPGVPKSLPVTIAMIVLILTTSIIYSMWEAHKKAHKQIKKIVRK